MSQFEKLFNFMKKPWVIIPYAFLVILVYYFVDQPLATYFYLLDLRVNIPFLVVLTALGKWAAYSVLFLLLDCIFDTFRLILFMKPDLGIYWVVSF